MQRTRGYQANQCKKPNTKYPVSGPRWLQSCPLYPVACSTPSLPRRSHAGSALSIAARALLLFLLGLLCQTRRAETGPHRPLLLDGDGVRQRQSLIHRFTCFSTVLRVLAFRIPDESTALEAGITSVLYNPLGAHGGERGSGRLRTLCGS